MSPKHLEDARQDFDELAWDKNDGEWEEARKALSKKSLCRRLELLVAEKFGKPATWISPMIIGGFNNLYRMRVEDFSPDVLVRRPSVSQTQFPEEKTLYEAATAKYIKQHTKIPTPRVFFYSDVSDVGPFIIIERIILELSCHEFSRIGSLLEADDGSFSVSRRPITQNMSDMLQLANIPSSIFSLEFQTFESSNDYYLNLAREHLAQLIFQQNDLVKSADDCRNNKQGRLSTFGFTEDNWSAQARTKPSKLLPAPSNSDSFRLYSDDFRPGNILINNANEVVSLSAMKKAEGSAGSKFKTSEFPILAYMRESWEAGRFWLSYAARKSWAFDTVFWNYLDERFFGQREGRVQKNELWKTRENLLSEGARNAMELFVERKMEEMKERKLVEWDPEVAKCRLEDVLLNGEVE
ncbi:phosphotransferase [Rhexocercosporidium sp. MPI-PUGE-AT-0058]|nr:phosphotransferase [Rhexocercosporidium sp. MPI-PUGE-AT-0058]